MQGSNDTYTVTQDRQQPGLAHSRLPETNSAKCSQQSDQVGPPRKHSLDGATKTRWNSSEDSFATHLSIPEGWKAELA